MENLITSPTAITKLAESIMSADAGAATGRATYLKSLLGATQAELAGKPVLRVTGRTKRPDIDTALAAFETAQKPFYDAVLAAVPDGLDALERQSKTSFARSAAATLRRAIATGWNPLAHAATRITKAELAVWTASHSEPRPLTPGRAEKRVVGLAERITETLEGLPQPDAARILALALEQLGVKTTEPQRITSMRLTRHERQRPAAH